jgi:hypothetical protein
MKRFLLTAMAATTLGCGPLQPIPANARANDYQAAAWSFASVFCNARGSGVPFDMAMRTAFVSAQELWGSRVLAPGFSQLAAAAIYARCEGLAKPPTTI